MKTGRGWQKSIAFTNSAGFMTHSHFHHHRRHSHIQRSKSHTSNAWGEKLETFFQGRHNSNRPRKKTTQTDNRAFKWSNHKKFQKITKCFEQNFTQRKEGEGTDSSSSGDFRGSHLWNPPKAPPVISFNTWKLHSHSKMYFHSLSSLSLHWSTRTKWVWNVFLKGLLGGLQKSVFSGCSLSCMRPRK